MESNAGKELLFIASFIIFLIFFYMLFGSKVLVMLLWLILAGQIVVNWTKLNSIIKGVVG